MVSSLGGSLWGGQEHPCCPTSAGGSGTPDLPGSATQGAAKLGAGTGRLTPARRGAGEREAREPGGAGVRRTQTDALRRGRRWGRYLPVMVAAR